ncbi:hypothetical protein AO741_13640 [Pseudomonas sp. TTU2014-105ASC]|nr:hypothetical protein AO741_13640 [Pseudomonas sp. TTU2014-105ASC]
MSSLSRHQVKLLSQILHSTSLSIGRNSQLAAQREKISRLLGFNDWNAASALLPDQIAGDTDVAIAVLEVPQHDAKTIMCVGCDAPWRLPEKVRDCLIDRSLDPSGFVVTSYTRPDAVLPQKPRYYETVLHSSPGESTTYRQQLAPAEVDYRPFYLTPIVMTFAKPQGQFAFKLTVWLISLRSETGDALYFTGATHKPLYNSIIQSLTGIEPVLREAYCLVSNADANFSYAIVRCDERGTELEFVKALRYSLDGDMWEQLKRYNDQLGLSILDVAEITNSLTTADSEDNGGETYD